jgi:endonuclease/exonuclease/phosphatase family metal-dependent hydrolase
VRLVLASLLGMLAQGLEVGTWNVQNYLVGNRFENGRFRYQYPMPEERKGRVRKLILETAPDILFLQEIGGGDFLRELQLDLRAVGMDYPHAFFGAPPGSRSGLAILSKIPPCQYIFHDPIPLGEGMGFLRRGVQEVAFRSGNTSFRFFHVHLKSRYSDDPDDPDSTRLRSLEITALAKFLEGILSTVGEESALGLIGDFNTPLDSPLMEPLKRRWSPVPAEDPAGSPHTYFHRSGRAEVIDGLWVPRHRSHPRLPGRLLPLPTVSPSDHRLALFFLNFNLPSPSYWQSNVNNEEDTGNLLDHGTDGGDGPGTERAESAGGI